MKRKLSMASDVLPASSIFSQGNAMAVDTQVVGTGAYSYKKRRLGVKTRGRKLNPRQRAEVKRIIAVRQELKYFASSQAATNATSTPSITGAPFDIPQGDTDSTRDGDRLMWCGTMEMNLQIVNGQGATGDLYNNVRVLIFQWHPNSVPNGANLFLAGPSGGTDIYSVYSHDYRQQFTILFDEVFTTVGNANAATTPNTPAVTTGVRRIRIPLKGISKQVQYTAGTTNGTNRLYICYFSDSALATHPTIAWASKVFYRDS